MTFASPTHIDNLVSISTGWRKNRSVARPKLFQIAFISVYFGNNDVVRSANAGPGIAQLGKGIFGPSIWKSIRVLSLSSLGHI
jgi:hypothetical protein